MATVIGSILASAPAPAVAQHHQHSLGPIGHRADRVEREGGDALEARDLLRVLGVGDGAALARHRAIPAGPGFSGSVLVLHRLLANQPIRAAHQLGQPGPARLDAPSDLPEEAFAMPVRSIYDYVPHHRTREKLDQPSRPVKVSDQLPHDNPIARFNSWFAVKVTNGVGTMWCAYAFAALALVSFPAAVSSHNAVTLVSWVSQTFLQLVLLSVIIVGQNVLAAAADKRAE
ncbi:MAG: hypothetical protein M0Z42_08260, partial [Actinomycetota bacterium]|nr:hypothetical protein [Actinomycetota bacterium]